MEHAKHRELIIDKSTEPRTPEISQMIDEGGLGADKYYEIMKQITSTEKDSEQTN